MDTREVETIEASRLENIRPKSNLRGVCWLEEYTKVSRRFLFLGSYVATSTTWRTPSRRSRVPIVHIVASGEGEYQNQRKPMIRLK